MAALTRITEGGRELATMPWADSPFEPSSSLVNVIFEFPVRSLTFETRQGDRIETELPDRNDLAPLQGRPVIYLDQNHWSAMAKAIHEPERLPQEERSAAEELIELARQRRVIMPLSMGHVGETGQWRNSDRRYRLALTMLDLSKGWQLCDVDALRRAELQRSLAVALRCSLPPAPAPVTLQPGAMSARSVERYQPGAEFDEELAFAMAALTETFATFDQMLDDVAIRRPPVPGWVERNQRITREIASGVAHARSLRRAVTLEAFRRDLPHELASAAAGLDVAPEDVGRWLRDLNEEQITSMPSLAIYRELLHEKLSDPGTVWEDNDLDDMMYLSCGAAYADHVVGERRLTSDLRHGLERLGRPVNVYRRLADLIPMLAC
ncbi:MAG TPA: hypothetical protein VGR26_07330 [Acidimicrobiales bacterium]|nr:hypothetical protein [Acidimicrobiales bacterium]